MLQLFKMAIRDLARNRRRSFFSSLALGMGLGLLLLMAAVIEGEMRGAMDSSIKLQSGHIQVRAATYEEDKTSLAWEDLVEDPGALAAKIAALAPVKAATPRLFATGIVVSGDNTAGVSILGLDPSSPASAPYRDGIVAGEPLGADDRTGLLIGSPLADQFGLQAGDEINLMVNTSGGAVDEQPFTIRGVYATGISSYDESTVILPLAKAQAIAGAENHASAIFVLLGDREQTASVTAALQTGRYVIVPWNEANDLLVDTEELSNAYMVVLYLIVLAITATVIVNTLVMSVFERTREIGILSAIGMKSGSIMAMFFAESSLLAVGGILMGLVLGGVMVAYATRVGFYIGDMGVSGMLISDRIYAYLTMQDTVTLTITAFVVTLLAALYPALLAARMEPVQALRGGK